MHESFEMEDQMPMLEDTDHEEVPVSKRLPPLPRDVLHQYRSFIIVATALICLSVLGIVSAVVFGKYFTGKNNISELAPAQYLENGLSSTSNLNFSKVVTMLNPVASSTNIALLVLYMAVVPDDWPFVIWCSEDDIVTFSQSAALSAQIGTGRLNMTVLPSEVDVHNDEYLSRFLTKPWFWYNFQPEAEWMLFIRPNVVLCAASEQSVDDWLGYDWVGAPTAWSHEFGHGGDGGLSIRKISTMQQVTSITDPTFVRKDWNGEGPDEGVWYRDSEDYWFMNAIDKTMGREARWPEDDSRDQNEFSVAWDSTVLRPLGVQRSAAIFGLYDSEAVGEDDYESMLRLLDYCPEISMVMGI